MTIDFALSPDQEAVEELFTRFFAIESPPAVVRAAEPLGFSAAVWDKAIELGAPGMGLPAEVDGGGATLAELAIVAESIGRAVAPAPLVDHIVAARVLAEPAADVVDGSTIASLALQPADDSGLWSSVPAGAVAGLVVGVEGSDLIAVRSTPPGDGPRNHGSVPLADRSCAAGHREVIGDSTRWSVALAEWKILTAASMVGVATRALELGVAYVKERHQFGRPIGSFQAVQHGFADLVGLVDGSRLLVHKAAWACDRRQPDPSAAGAALGEVDDNEVIEERPTEVEQYRQDVRRIISETFGPTDLDQMHASGSAKADRLYKALGERGLIR